MHEGLITTPIDSINDVLDGVVFKYFAPANGSVAARVERWDNHGPVCLEAAGTAKDCWQFVRGLEVALEVTNRLPRG